MLANGASRARTRQHAIVGLERRGEPASVRGPQHGDGLDLVAGLAEQVGAASVDRQHDPADVGAGGGEGLGGAPHLVARWC